MVILVFPLLSFTESEWMYLRTQSLSLWMTIWLLIGLLTNYLKPNFFLQAEQVISSSKVSRSISAPHLGQKSDWKSSEGISTGLLIVDINIIFYKSSWYFIWALPILITKICNFIWICLFVLSRSSRTTNVKLNRIIINNESDEHLEKLIKIKRSRGWTNSRQSHGWTLVLMPYLLRVPLKIKYD